MTNSLKYNNNNLKFPSEEFSGIDRGQIDNIPEEYKKVLQCIRNSSPSEATSAERKFPFLGVQTNIEVKNFKKLPNKDIDIKRSLYLKLLDIAELTAQTNQEIPFLMIGTTTSNKIKLTQINITKKVLDLAVDKKLSTEEVSFDYYQPTLQKIIGNPSFPNSIICIMHTHPDATEEYRQWSLGDLYSLKTFTENTKSLTNNVHEQGILYGVLSEDGITSFVNYENESFYNLDSIQVS